MSERTTNSTAVPPEHAVVIAAAVATIYGEGARVLSVQPAREHRRGSEPAAWLAQGREALMSSHQPPRRSS